MTTKKQRQHEIAKLIGLHNLSSQSDLVSKLADSGISATQATVSRDLENLGAIKIRIASSAEPVYAIPELPSDQIAPSQHLSKVLSEWVVEIQHSGDLVILRTPPGGAHIVASALDRSTLGDVIGTVGGDDTVLVIAKEGLGNSVSDQLIGLAELNEV